MLKSERLERIEEYINHNRYVTIPQLAEEFGISASTIRRDLEALGEAGRVELTRGGVMSLHRKVSEEASYHEKTLANREEKARIAAAAARMIKPGCTLFVDSGTTTRELVPFLKEGQGLKLVTNDLLIASELSSAQGVEVILPGGLLRRGYYTLTGSQAEEMVSSMRADLTFMGFDAVRPRGFMISNQEEVGLKRAMARCGSRLVVLCDHTKFESDSFITVCPLADASLIITGKELEEGIRKRLEAAGAVLELV
ncbi:MAG: DeoR/GlpR transcriptional regulator [Oscillospiraceae bacterium]|nr:DeoR/GlpR transcriptional regulator [Oscillospiraceae bacterium]